MIKFPPNDARFSWTSHIKNKMVFYHISPNEIKTIFSRPDRVEEGIAEGTIGAMRIKKTQSKEKPETEVWIMYKIANSRQPLAIRKKEEDKKYSKTNLPVTGYPLKARITMISTWRYPGRTKPGERPNIPLDILEALEKFI